MCRAPCRDDDDFSFLTNFCARENFWSIFSQNYPNFTFVKLVRAGRRFGDFGQKWRFLGFWRESAGGARTFGQKSAILPDLLTVVDLEKNRKN